MGFLAVQSVFEGALMPAHNLRNPGTPGPSQESQALLASGLASILHPQQNATPRPSRGRWCVLLPMPKLRSLAPRLRYAEPSVRLPPKVKASIYNTPEFQAWRTAVVDRAGGRCEAVDPHGHRCSRATPHHRIYADHITELHDGGLPYALDNGQALCASHHAIKTMTMRSRRHSKLFDGG